MTQRILPGGQGLTAASSEEQPYRPGNRGDFDRLYRASQPRLVRTLYALLGDSAAAEDCVQEAFVRAFGAWASWRPDAPAEAWVHRIAFNVAVSYRRRQRLREVGEVVRRLGRPAESPDPARVAERSVLLDALRSLPPEQAAAIVLRHYHGYTNRELAVALGVSERTIGSRLSHARERLNEILGDRALPTPEESDVEELMEAEGKTHGA